MVKDMERKEQMTIKGLSRNSGQGTVHNRPKSKKEQETERN